MVMSEAIFITGVTGLIGRELLYQLLNGDQEHQITVLIRPKAIYSAEARLEKLLQSIDIDPIKSLQVSVVSGDITKKFLGMPEGQYQELANRIDTIFHLAAVTDLMPDKEHATIHNVEGTARLLKFAKLSSNLQGAPIKFRHVSTAYVCGQMTGVVSPDDLPISGFRNLYEQTKAEAERLVRVAASELDVLIYRPSIVVGYSNKWTVSRKKTIPLILKLLITERLMKIPVNANVLFDFVLVDYVAQVIWELHKNNQVSGNCYHLASGCKNEVSAEQLVNYVSNFYLKCGKVLSKPDFVDIHLYKHEPLSERIRSHLPYLQSNPIFDVNKTTRMIEDSLGFLPFETYVEDLCRDVLV